MNPIGLKLNLSKVFVGTRLFMVGIQVFTIHGINTDHYCSGNQIIIYSLSRTTASRIIQRFCNTCSILTRYDFLLEYDRLY